MAVAFHAGDDLAVGYDDIAVFGQLSQFRALKAFFIGEQFQQQGDMAVLFPDIGASFFCNSLFF